jgi:hypothetical protein
MKYFAALILLIASQTSFASESYLQGALGFESGAVNIGFDYESRKSGSNAGYGGYFMFSSEKDGASAQVLSFGAMSKIHFFETEQFDFSLAPGFGISMVEIGNADETVFGPILKLGLLYKFSDKVAFGGEMFKAYNWLSDEFAGTLDYFNFVVRLSL